MKHNLKKMAGTLLLASSLLCPNLAFAQDDAVVNSSVNYLGQTQEIPDSGVTVSYTHLGVLSSLRIVQMLSASSSSILCSRS